LGTVGVKDRKKRGWGQILGLISKVELIIVFF